MTCTWQAFAKISSFMRINLNGCSQTDSTYIYIETIRTRSPSFFPPRIPRYPCFPIQSSISLDCSRNYVHLFAFYRVPMFSSPSIFCLENSSPFFSTRSRRVERDRNRNRSRIRETLRFDYGSWLAFIVTKYIVRLRDFRDDWFREKLSSILSHIFFFFFLTIRVEMINI